MQALSFVHAMAICLDNSSRNGKVDWLEYSCVLAVALVTRRNLDFEVIAQLSYTQFHFKT